MFVYDYAPRGTQNAFKTRRKINWQVLKESRQPGRSTHRDFQRNPRIARLSEGMAAKRRWDATHCNFLR